MSRRRTAPRPGAYLGDLDNAKAKVNRLMQQTATVMTSFHGSFGNTLEMLFDPDTLERATKARGHVVSPHSVVTYKIADHVTMTMDFTDALPLPIRPEALKLQVDKVQPLHDVVQELSAIYLKFEEVKALVRWFNENATLAAIRYYWPPIIGLFPALYADKTEVSERFGAVNRIGERLQMIRDTQTTMAAARMLPENTEPRMRGRKMWLNFQARAARAIRQPDVHYVTEDITFNL
jgi:hypothetical protein